MKQLSIRFSLLLMLVFQLLIAHGQDKSPAKFGNVTPKEFSTTLYTIDSGAKAVVLADIGSTVIEGNRDGWFSLVFKRYTRIHILKKSGYDAATFNVILYKSGDAEERLDRLKAVTYNLEGNKVSETKLDAKDNVFTEKLDKNVISKKFTLPNVKEGSIIEVEYSITSDFLENFQPWTFQGEHPVLWSEYNVSIPEFFGYVMINQGYHMYDINDRKTRNEAFRVINSRGSGAAETFDFRSDVTDYRWVMKDVWPLKEESFTSTLENHISKVEFQLSERRYPLSPKNFMGTWKELASRLLESEYFGKNLVKENGFLKDIVKPITEALKTPNERARRIFDYVRSNYTKTGNGVWMTQNLRGVAKSKTGNVADINLLLTALLKEAGLQAEPVILSTRGHGFTLPTYPLLQKFNYVVTQLVLDNQTYYLDASEPRIGFGYLPLRCYNGHARLLTEECPAIDLPADSVHEKRTASAYLVPDEKNHMTGKIQLSPGRYESLSIRERMRESGRSAVESDIRKSFLNETEITDLQLDSLELVDKNLAITYNFSPGDFDEDIVYINPMFSEAHKENPFKSAERFYPVEMPYAFDEVYTLYFDVPSNYVVDELPKPMVVRLNEADEGMFEYRISQSGTTVSLRSRIRINRAYFAPEEYEMLREFYNLIIKKHAEQIVLKKKK